jgi:hypothetical protein
MKAMRKAAFAGIAMFAGIAFTLRAEAPSGTMTIKAYMNLIKQSAQVTVTKSPDSAKFTRTSVTGAILIGNPGINDLSFAIKSDTPSHAKVKGVITVPQGPGIPSEKPFPVSADAWFVSFFGLIVNNGAGSINEDTGRTTPTVVSLHYKPADAPVEKISATVEFKVNKKYKGNFSYDNNGAEMEGSNGFVTQSYTGTWHKEIGATMPKTYSVKAVVKCENPVWTGEQHDK